MSQSREGVKTGVRAMIAVIVLVLLISLAQLTPGKPIVDLGSTWLSAAYVVLVYVPLLALCALALRRLSKL